MIYYILHQVDEIRKKILFISRVDVHPDVVDLFMRVSSCEEFWLDLTSPKLYSLLLRFGPFFQIEMDIEDIYTLSLVFRTIIDFRSPFTATHSTGVAATAGILSKIFGFTDTERTLLEMAGNLHDLGKLTIPNSILNKPKRLTERKFAIIKRHTYFTYSILSSLEGLNQIAKWASFHHERLDGSGYPFHVGADEINVGARIMAVADLFTALAEDRPYRRRLEEKEIKRILLEHGGRGLLDKRIVNLLFGKF